MNANMQKIDSKEELTMVIRDYNAYDIDSNKSMFDMGYKYPIWVDYRGTTSFGVSYRVYTKKDLQHLKQTLLG